MSYTIKEIYHIFRKAQANFFNRPYRLPKDWDKFYSKLSDNRKDPLKKITLKFNTTWNNIDPYDYFCAGFELFKNTFSYVKFFNPKILELYIRHDKNRKRQLESNKREIIESVKFIHRYLESLGKDTTRIFIKYSQIYDGHTPVALLHYKQNKINTVVFVYLLSRNYITLSDYEWSTIPFVNKRLKSLIKEMLIFENFFKRIEDMYNK